MRSQFTVIRLSCVSPGVIISIGVQRDWEEAMRQAAESQASIWQETEKKMRCDLERLLTQEEHRRCDVQMDKAHNQR